MYRVHYHYTHVYLYSPTFSKRQMFWQKRNPTMPDESHVAQRYNRQRMTAVSKALANTPNIVSRLDIELSAVSRFVSLFNHRQEFNSRPYMQYAMCISNVRCMFRTMCIHLNCRNSWLSPLHSMIGQSRTTI